MKCKVLCFIVRHKQKFQRSYCYFGDAIVCSAFSILKHGNKIRLIKGHYQATSESFISQPVDACSVYSRVEKLGYDIPSFDFRNPGVTSMSADVHKYGYGVKV